nr:unnamed protein product [Callosobruchus analis]
MPQVDLKTSETAKKIGLTLKVNKAKPYVAKQHPQFARNPQNRRETAYPGGETNNLNFKRQTSNTRKKNPSHQNYAGRLKNYLTQWKAICHNPVVIQWIKGVKIPFKDKPFQTTFKKAKFSQEERQLYKQQNNSLLKIGAISKQKSKPGEFISPYVLRRKPDGKFRFILNLKNFIEAPHFKIEDYRTATQLISKESFLANIDLKDAYYLISIHKNYRKYLRFSFDDEIYEFNCLPFGLSVVPYIFTKLLKPVVATFRKHGIMLVAYLDDLLIIDNTEEGCRRALYSH